MVYNKKAYERQKRWIAKNKDWYMEYRRKQYRKPEYILKRISYRAKSRGIKFDLPKTEFVKWYVEQPQECHYCGITFKQMQKTKDTMLVRFNKTFSIDRMDNNGGYELGNIVLACNRCNFIKGDYFNYREMIGIAGEYVKPKIKSI